MKEEIAKKIDKIANELSNVIVDYEKEFSERENIYLETACKYLFRALIVEDIFNELEKIKNKNENNK